MRSGFLVQDGDARPATQRLHTDPEQGSGAAAAPPLPPQPAASGAPPPQRTPEQLSAGLAECLELLKGPSDERRFVGLLLVTKLLPAGDAATIRAVHAAVGPTFLARLLLPLSSRAPPPAGAEAAQKAAASCALGLAVLSSFVRVPDLAASADVLDKLPLLLNVVRAGGIAPLLAPRAAAAAPAAAGGGAGDGAAPAAVCNAASDAAAVQDALECVVAVARSGEEGRAVAADSGALAAAAAVLQRCRAEETQQLSLALQLMAALLADEGQRTEVQGNTEAVLGQLLPALARVFALPAQQLQAGGSGGRQAGAAEQQQLQQRLLAIQLEALHVLLLLLPLPQSACLPAEQLEGEAPGGPVWLVQLRQGLALLLRGRVSAVQRHSALQLAAAVVDLAGPGWVLGHAGGASSSGGRSGGGASGRQAAAEAKAFFQLLVEITKVETSVLLHDALAPDVPVPLASAAGASAAEWRPPPPRRAADDACSSGGSEAGDGLHEAGAELAADLAEMEEGEQAADMQPLLRVLHSEEDRRQMEAQLQREQAAAEAAATAAAGASSGRKPREQMRPGEHMQQVDEVQIPADMRWEGPTEAAGARAARVLPACFALLEACIEALAVDTQRAEATLEAGAPAAALSDAVAQRALFSLQEAVEVVLQFIEQTCDEVVEEAKEQAAASVGALVRRALLLGALRALARFCAEVPEAFGARLRLLLPTLLALSADPGSHSTEQAGPPAEGATFLLPLLLQVSDPGYGQGSEQQERERQLWLRALGEPDALRQLARHTQQCAAACPPAVASPADMAADDALLYACQLLLNVVGGEQLPSSGSSAVEAAAAARRQLAAAPEAQPLLSGLVGLAARRGEALASPQGSPDQVVHANRLLVTLAAVGSTIAAQLAADLPPEQRPQQAAGTAEQLPALGPLSGQLMTRLCSQLLAALQAAAALTGPEPLPGRLAPRLGIDAATLAAARSAAAEDEALQLELARSLDTAGASAAALLRAYPPLAALGRQHQLAAAGLAAGGGNAAAGELPDGLLRFLAAVAESA